MPSTRPTGFFTTSKIYSNGENAYGILKKFLFDTTSGRTDVVFMGELSTYFEGDDGLGVGGLGDGIAKAILKGNPSVSRSSRKLYATPIFWGYHAGTPNSNYNPITQNWLDNNVGSAATGRVLVGCRPQLDCYQYRDKASLNNQAILPFNGTFIGLNGFSFGSLIASPNNSAYVSFDSKASLTANSVLPSGASNNVGVNLGPVATPWILNNQRIAFYTSADILSVRVGSWNPVTNTISALEPNVQLLKDIPITFSYTPMPSWVNVGASINSTPTDSRLSFEADQQIYFRVPFEAFVLPFLREKKSFTYNNNCTTGHCAEDIIKVGSNYGVRKHLPYNLSASGSQYLFSSLEQSITSGKELSSLPPHPAPTNNFTTSYQDGLMPCLNYTRVHDFYLQNGSLFTNEVLGTGSITLLAASITGHNRNPATECLMGPFIWGSNWDQNIGFGLGTYFKNKGFTVGTGRTAASTGHFFQSISGSAPYTITTAELSEPERADIFGLFRSVSFMYKIQYLRIRDGLKETNGTLALTVSTASNTTVLDSTVTMVAPTTTTQIACERAFISPIINLSSVNTDTLKFSFTGWNSSVESRRLSGNAYVVNHWGEDPSILNGISFSTLHSTYDFRTGDLSYSFNSNKRSPFLEDFFKTIAERQLSNIPWDTSSGARKKLVIAIHLGRFENATPAEGYLGGWSQNYLESIKAFIIPSILNSGFTEDEFVFWFIGPYASGKVEYWSDETPDYSHATGIVKSYTKSKFIFVGNSSTNSKGGLLKAVIPWTNKLDPANTLFEAVYTDPDTVPGFTPVVTALVSNTGLTRNNWYYTPQDENESPTTALLSAQGFLALGNIIVDAMFQETSTNVIAPSWIKLWCELLELENEPIENTPVAFMGTSSDPALINPYYQAFNAAVNSNNLVARKIKTRFKHKTIQ
jgi:hypothetical protein